MTQPSVARTGFLLSKHHALVHVLAPPGGLVKLCPRRADAAEGAGLVDAPPAAGLSAVGLSRLALVNVLAPPSQDVGLGEKIFVTVGARYFSVQVGCILDNQAGRGT